MLTFYRFVCLSDLAPTEIPHLDIPLHTVLKLVPKAYSCEVTRFKLGVDSCEDHTAASPQPSEEEQAKAEELVAQRAAEIKGAGIVTVAATSTAALEQGKETIVHVSPANQTKANSKL